MKQTKNSIALFFMYLPNVTTIILKHSSMLIKDLKILELYKMFFFFCIT